jgi:hypothetical protein
VIIGDLKITNNRIDVDENHVPVMRQNILKSKKKEIN